MSEEVPAGQRDSVDVSAESARRLDRLVRLLEDDRLGYRLERYVAGVREELTATLSGEEFSVAPQPGLTLFETVEAYDRAVLPYVEFFAVGSSYSEGENASLWADFIERIAIRGQRREGSYNEEFSKLSLYPALLLLYGAGLLAVARRRWTGILPVLSRQITVGAGQERPFVLTTNPFLVLSETAQQAIPGREKTYTPLLDHLHDRLKPALLTYFLDEARYSAAFTYFETILGTTSAFADQQEREARSGQVTESVRVPVGRYWWLGYGQSTPLDNLEREAKEQGETWPPAVAGLYAGSTQVFLDLVPKAKEYVSRQGRW